MRTIDLDDRSFVAHPGETVLETLLRYDVRAPHSCKAGVCGSCLVKAVSGVVPPAAQVGLKDSWVAQGYFLSCVCRPESDLQILLAGRELKVPAKIRSLQLLSHNVLQVRLETLDSFSYRSGQFLTLQSPTFLARSYSIASLPEESNLELHIRLLPHGQMSSWLRNSAKLGDEVTLLGPNGDCFYVAGRPHQPLLLVGTGTGLAPLYGILRDALRQGHEGPIHLFHGALNLEGLYLREELQKIASQHPNFKYTPCTVQPTEEEGVARGSIDAAVLERHHSLTGYRAFVCGDPALVQKLKKLFFVSGVASRDLHTDSFLPAATG